MSQALYRTTAERRYVAALAAAIVAIFFTAAVQAQTTITVDSSLDDAIANHCTLRDAINSAIGMSGIGSCGTGSGPFTINFSASVDGHTITLGRPLPTIAIGTNLIITGPTNAPGITIDGNNTFRPLDVGGSFESGATLALNNITIAHGRAPSGQAGGGVFVDTSAALTVTNCTFLGNSSSDDSGGAIAVNAQGAATVINSTFTGNKAHGGGAILNIGTLTVTNSTFDGNSAAATNGGGILTGLHATTDLKGTILAANSGDNCLTVRGTLNDDGYNLSDDDSCHFNGTGSHNGVADSDLNLGSLADNGGPTKTIALQTGSIAIDAMPPASCTFPSGALNPCTNPPSLTMSDQLTCDQRGEARPDPEDSPAGNCDIGTFESGAEAAIDCSNAAASTPNLIAISPLGFYPESVTSVTDSAGPFSISITGVRQDKPGPALILCPNAKILGATAFVRTNPEPLLGSGGLLYSIQFKATDEASGASCTGAVPVCVQDIFHRGQQCSASVPIYDATKCP